ncbi:GNVR domain-containing protein [Microvirga massiliensis]|uniref:GNVR domain-containing protein n=1 Tax=Microvirga massiliensis TaxID=1033741 RepID=UPI0006617069|nr:GNVR domain-containing protein [Microvirga massiliensis]
MLQMPTRKPIEDTRIVPAGERDSNEYFDLRYIFGAIRRQSKLIMGLAVIGLIVGIIYVATSIPLYTTTTSIIIDRRQVRAVQDVSAVTDIGLDAPVVVDSQVEVLKSERIALAVVDQLNLVSDSSFWAPEGWLFTWIYGSVNRALRGFFADLLGESKLERDPAQEQEARRWAAVYRLLGKTTITRLGKTYIITVSVEATDPDQAVRIANAYVEAYLADQLDAKYDVTRRANVWLQARLDELRQQSVQSDLAVQQFRAANQLIAVGGQLVSESQLAELSTQVSMARGDVAKAGARLERIRAVLSSKEVDALLAEASGNPAISELQTRYLAASRREAEISAQFGPDHERAVQYRSEKAEITRQLVEELTRIAENYEGEYHIAKSRLESLDQNVDRLISVAAEANNKQVQLRELEREAETYRTLYQSFLQRYQQTVQQQSFPMSEARVVTPAVPPLQPSHPKTVPIILLSTLIGAIIGGSYGAIREYRDVSFRTAAQVREELGLKCLGMLPIIKRPARGSTVGHWLSRPASSRDQGMDAHSPMSYVLRAPQSEFAAALRSVATSSAHTCSGRNARVIGVMSAARHEGRTVLAASLAEVFTQEGGHTLLIDADIRNPTLTKAFAPDAAGGLLEVLTNGQPWRTALHRVSDSDLMMIPATSCSDAPNTSRSIMSDHFEEVLRETSECFEWIIVDLPPLGTESEAWVMARKIDCLLLVIDWGHTPMTLVKEMLTVGEVSAPQCIGVVLNRVDMKLLRLYQDHPTVS